jgi:hypothetical protein
MELKVTKLQAAESQLITAIELYFRGGDPISIHALARNSHELLDMLCKAKGYERGILHQGMTQIVKPEHKDFVFKKVNEARNFFKHADKDPEEILTWNPEISTYFIWDATSLYRRLVGDDTPCEIFAFSAIFRIEHSELWVNKSAIDHLLEDAKAQLHIGGIENVYDMATKMCKDGKNKPKSGAS